MISRSAVQLVKRTTIYQGRVIKLIQEILKVQGQRIMRETIQHPGAVVIVPFLTRTQVVFVRQYRRAVKRELLELPAGTLEKGESPLTCARRELEEETGWKPHRMRRIGRFYAAPGFVSEQMTIFLAQGLVAATAQPEPDERIETVVLSLREALGKIHSGAICDAKTIIGVLFAHRALRG